jgi:hypothetical protein
MPSRFRFIPDGEIEWHASSDGSGMDAFRGGRPLPLALRKHPHVHVQMRDEFMSLISGGVAALDARDQVATDWATVLREQKPL